MKKIFLLALIAIAFQCAAAPIFKAPAIRIQPNGDTLRCLLSGDEYYHRLHDADGYTIVQNRETGWWVYATKGELRRSDRGERWDVVATDYVAGRVNPASVGLTPNIGVDHDTWLELQKRYDVPKEYQHTQAKTAGRNHGTLNNIVIFVRFSDDSEISTPFSTIDYMFNDSSANSNSMYNYFKHASYNKIYIPTHYYPAPNGNNVISYQDSMPRGYYLPYNAVTAPNGYADDNERRSREFGLLERAVNYINANNPVSTSLNLDMDNDGEIDNICFVVKGTYTGWSDLLWPHKWSLYDRQVYINGKRVYTFNLQLEGSGEHYFSSSTFCHEMFHTLGAPDLYRYETQTEVSGVGSWDLMCSNTTPPQHMSAYMKWKYGNWLDSIPEITVPGTYTLHSLADDDYSNCVYKIAAQEPHQWYVLEYRDNTELFETALPGKGLIIFRVDDRYNGNANYDGVTYFDEVYLFRPNAHNDTTNGTLNQAYYSANTTRTAFNPSTNPHPWLTGNVLDSTISISNVTAPGTTISFTYSDLRGCRVPTNMATSNISGNSANLSWSGNTDNYTLQWRVSGLNNITNVSVSGSSHNLTNLSLSTEYQWRVKSLCASGDSSDYTEWQTFRTESCAAMQATEIGNQYSTTYHLPINTYYNYSYSQMIYLPAEINGEMNISKIAFNYASNNELDTKTECHIYLGHTSQTTFDNNTSMVPYSQLYKVYEGPIHCTSGWNEIDLDSTFHYDGTSNLVVAIWDNSGSYSSSAHRFYCSTLGNQYRSLTYFSDDFSPCPYSSSMSGNAMRQQYRPNIRFRGCLPADHTVTIVNNTPNLGAVSGAGQYNDGESVTITATPAADCEFDYWVTEGDTIQANPYTFTVNSDVTFTAYFSQPTYTVTVTATAGGTVDGGGDYVQGSMATVTATPYEHYQFKHWQDPATNDIVSENPYTFVVSGDRTLVATFDKDKYRVQVGSANPELGEAWFTTEESSMNLNDDSIAYGTEITLFAQPNTGMPNMVSTFVHWTDNGSTENPRTITVTNDFSANALFSGSTDIEIAEGDITVYTTHRDVHIVGAEGKSMHLYDITGRKICEAKGSGHTTIHVNNNGVYILRIEGAATKKIVIVEG